MLDTETLIKVVIPITMFSLMFAMGLTLTTADFKRILAVPRATLMGLIVLLLVLPVMGLSLAYAFNLPLMMAVGLVALAACPGGTTSNVVAHIGKGDTALSVTLTATATMATLVTLPLWINLSLYIFGGSGTNIEMPILQTGGQLFLFTVLPVLLGMFARSRKPALLKYEPLLTKISVVAMASCFILMAVIDEHDSFSRAGQVILPTVLLIVLAAVVGFVVPKLAGVNVKSSATIAVESCLKNILISFFLASSALSSLDAALASAVAGAIIMPVAICVMLAFNLFNKSQEKLAAS